MKFFFKLQSAFWPFQTVTVSECRLIKLLPCIFFEKNIYILALEMASTGNRHCANCIGTLSFPIGVQFSSFAVRPTEQALGVSVKANCSHRHARHDDTVVCVRVALSSACELDFPQLNTVADRKF